MKVRFFIYENNSIDNTKKVLLQLSEKYQNIFIKMEDIDLKNLDRIEKIKLARNNLHNFYTKYICKNKIGGNWLFIYDTDILFNYEISIKPLIESQKNLEGLMFMTFSIFAGYNYKLNYLLLKKKHTQQEKNFFI